MLANILTVANIILSATVVYCGFRAWRRTHWFMDLLFALVFLGWIAIYVFVLIQEPGGYDTVRFGAEIVRPLNMLTFGLVAAATWFRWRNVNR